MDKNVEKVYFAWQYFGVIVIIFFFVTGSPLNHRPEWARTTVHLTVILFFLVVLPTVEIYVQIKKQQYKNEQKNSSL